MKIKMKTTLAIILLTGLTACNQGTDKATANKKNLETDTQKLSYAMGLDVGKSLKNLETDVDADAFALAVNDVLSGEKVKLPEELAANIKQEFFRKKQASQMAKRKSAGSENKTKGEAFLAENAKKDGIKVTASGLQYEVIKQGDGAKPKPENTVKVHYKGTTIDGTEFDSSYSRGQPISFPLNGVIPGWTEGVALMPVGSKYRFFIPSDLAYGERGAGAKIGPNSTLIFDVELLAIEK
ncbi:MAG: FKBP-type peptidyl-prolyl cis-trans isomerase [Ghiorsea sp.]